MSHCHKCLLGPSCFELRNARASSCGQVFTTVTKDWISNESSVGAEAEEDSSAPAPTLEKSSGHFFVSMCDLKGVAVDYWWISIRELNVERCVGLPSQGVKKNWLSGYIKDKTLEVCAVALENAHSRFAL